MNETTQPRYVEIAGYLRGLIEEAAAGDRLPSDAELCARFGVSRMTARHAMAQLAEEGLVWGITAGIVLLLVFLKSN